MHDFRRTFLGIETTVKGMGRMTGWWRLPGLLGSLLVIYGMSGLTGTAGFSMENTYRVSHYEIQGNTVLPPETTDSLFTNAIGSAVTLSCICRTLAMLREAYRERGYLQVSVTLPEQQLNDGAVLIEVIEGALLIEPADGLAKAPSPTTQSNRIVPPPFEVRGFVVDGNTLLEPKEIERILAPATGPTVTIDRVRQAAASLQHAYRERGYATVAVRVPSQRLTNATVRLEVVEGTLASIQIVGNRYFSSNNVARALPSLHTGTLLNSHVLQRELDEANQNRDRQIYPTLGPGPDPGTSALVLRVNDRLPLHAHLETDNYSTPGTPGLRVNTALQYDNLWQQEHQLGVAYSFSPQAYKTIGNMPDFGLNQPRISSYSGYYRIPIRSGQPVSEQIAGSPQFGYQEATHQFLLPPPQANSELILYASANSSDTGVKWGPITPVPGNLNLSFQDSGQNLSGNQNIGSQFRIPLLDREQSSWSGYLGADFKRFTLASYNTNNLTVLTYTSDSSGVHTNAVTTGHGQQVVKEEVVYLPLNAGLDFSESDTNGSTAVDLGIFGNFVGNINDFAQAAYSTNAKAFYAKATFSANREQRLPKGYSFVVWANGQAATGALINNEQFALGGIDSVRGYYEGDEYGDSGWSGSLELRSPHFEVPVANLYHFVPAWLRASVFTDAGQRFLLEPEAGMPASRWLWAAGFGLSANVNNHLDARVIVAWPLLPSANTAAGQASAYFTIGGQF